MRNDRNNQDQYDVIQAQEEFDSMQDPRTAVLLAEIERLKARVAELEEYEFMYKGLEK